MTAQSSPAFRRDVLPLHLEPLAAEARANSRDEFERQHPEPFLLYTRSELWDRKLLAAPAGDGETEVARYELYEAGMTFAQPVRKTQTDPRRAGIVLGRAMTQDLVVPVPSVSSAHVELLPPGPGAPRWSVVDLASRNGTWIGEERLPHGEPRVIAEGQYLRLGGNLIAWFLGAGRLWELLRDPAALRRYTEP